MIWWCIGIGRCSTCSIQDHGRTNRSSCMKMWVPPHCFHWNLFVISASMKLNFFIQYVEVLLASIINGFFSIQISSSISRSAVEIHLRSPLEKRGSFTWCFFERLKVLICFRRKTKQSSTPNSSTGHGPNSFARIHGQRRSMFWLRCMRCTVSSASAFFGRSDDLRR